MILGIDEVGRGPWAGPLVVGAVVLGGVDIPGLTDSKKLSKKKREELDYAIREKAKCIGLGWVDSATIDEIGLSKALCLATKQAVEQITVPYHEIIIDGTINFLKETNKGSFVTTMKKADLLIPCVSAASIIAKVARDKYMSSQDEIFPGYDFKSHVGYGTPKHQNSIEQLGTTPLHRLSFIPLKKYIKNKQSDMLELATSKEVGNLAENIAIRFLTKKGHKIINRNWKTKYCEIDIVSLKLGTIYFTEVKYRKNANQGGGISAISASKLRQMRFAAELYAISNNVRDMDMHLSVISLCGQPPVIESFLEVE